MFPSDTLNTILELLGCWLLASFALAIPIGIRLHRLTGEAVDPDKDRC